MANANFEYLYRMPLGLLVSMILLGLLVAAEGGFRWGTRVRDRQEQQASNLVGTVLTGVLGLLALLLAFTFSAATLRSEQRKQALIAEANALGTAYLRADLLAEPTRTQLRSLLRQYTDSRILADDTLQTPADMAAVIAESERIQRQLWPTAARGMSGRPPNLTDSLMLSALNAVIDMHTTRLAAGRDRLPGIVILMLIGVGIAAQWMAGYEMGLVGRRHPFLTTTLAVLCTGIIMVTLDLDRPRAGWVRLSQQSLIETRASMNDDAPATAPATTPGRP